MQRWPIVLKVDILVPFGPKRLWNCEDLLLIMMADGAHIVHIDITITPPLIVRFRSNLVPSLIISNVQGQRVKNQRYSVTYRISSSFGAHGVQIRPKQLRTTGATSAAFKLQCIAIAIFLFHFCNCSMSIQVRRMQRVWQ